MNSFCLVGKGASEGIVVATRGLYEYEVYRDGKNTIGITLLRAVGEMGDWFYFPTPAAQMQGEYEYEYCVTPFGDDLEAVLSNSYNFSYPKLCARAENRHEGLDSLADLHFDTEGVLLVSAVKKAEESDDVIVRMYNPLRTTAFVRSEKKFSKTNMAETLAGEEVTRCDVKSKKILTVRVKK